jgi:hypothetical protein
MAPAAERITRLRKLATTTGIGLLIVVAIVVAFLAITTLTGFPGPGPLRRYRISDLDAVAAKINGRGSVSLYTKSHVESDVLDPAKVDWLLDRIVVPNGLCVDAHHPLSASELAMVDGHYQFCGVANTE